MGVVDTGDTPTILISPTEPLAIRNIGIVSSLVEKKGCDALIITPSLRIGIQRKTWVDLVISLDDGRLANSIPKMDMQVRVVILEGQVNYGRDGHMVVRSNSSRARHGVVSLRHTRESLAGVVFSLRFTHGLDVFRTDSVAETALVIQRLGMYLSRNEHKGISGNRYSTGLGHSPWGSTIEERRRQQQVNFLMGMGVGVKTATNIIAKFGGLPFTWKVTKEQLLSVNLVGESVANKLIKFFDP